MNVTPEIQRILAANDEIELSEFPADLEAKGNDEGLGHQHAVPTLPHEHVDQLGHEPVPVRPEGGPQEIPPPLAAEGEAKPRRPRKVAQAARVAGENGNGAPHLASVFLTIPDVAQLFHMHPGSVWRLVCEGRLPGVKLGRVLIPAEAVTAFIKARNLKPRQWARCQKETPGEA